MEKPKRARRRKPETAKADLKPPLDEVGHCDHCLGTAIRMSSEELQRPTSDFRSGLARGAFHSISHATKGPLGARALRNIGREKGRGGRPFAFSLVDGPHEVHAKGEV